MRNGVKSYYNKNKTIYPILIIPFVIFLGFLIWFILNSKKVDINLDITSYDNLKDLKISNEGIIKAELYEEIEKSPQNSNSTFYGDCANEFIKANAMVIGNSTAEGLSAYGVLDPSSVIWTRGQTIQHMKDSMSSVIPSNPSVLFLSYGANDLLSWNGNVDGYINAYSNAIDYIYSVLPNTRICVNSILPVSDQAKSSNSAYNYQEEFNTRLKELCNSKNVTFIDNSSVLNNSPDGRIYESDGVHPRPFYYKQWAYNMIIVSGI